MVVGAFGVMATIGLLLVGLLSGLLGATLAGDEHRGFGFAVGVVLGPVGLVLAARRSAGPTPVDSLPAVGSQTGQASGSGPKL